MGMSPVHQVWPKPSCKALWKGDEDKADTGRGGKTTAGNAQAWSLPSPRGQWKTEKNGGNWLRNHLRCPNDPCGQGIDEREWSSGSSLPPSVMTLIQLWARIEYKCSGPAFTVNLIQFNNSITFDTIVFILFSSGKVYVSRKCLISWSKREIYQRSKHGMSIIIYQPWSEAIVNRFGAALILFSFF